MPWQLCDPPSKEQSHKNGENNMFGLNHVRTFILTYHSRQPFLFVLTILGNLYWRHCLCCVWHDLGGPARQRRRVQVQLHPRYANCFFFVFFVWSPFFFLIFIISIYARIITANGFISLFFNSCWEVLFIWAFFLLHKFSNLPNTVLQKLVWAGLCLFCCYQPFRPTE